MSESEETIMRWRVAIPESVVCRDFPEETVVLNLQTGMYHGLNATAARMLRRFTECATVGEAVRRLAEELDQPRPVIQADAAELCRALRERQLVSVELRELD